MTEREMESYILKNIVEKDGQKYIAASALDELFLQVNSTDTDIEMLNGLLKKQNVSVKEDKVYDLSTEDYLTENSTFTDGMELYLHQIGKYPLLTAEEEYVLASDKSNPKSREKLYNHNLRLVVSIAKRYVGKTKIGLEDLVQDGNIGLMKAVDKYDPDMGFKFSTYATWWIKQSITRSMADYSRLVRIPVHANEKLAKVYKINTDYYQKNNRNLNHTELATYYILSEKAKMSTLSSSLEIDADTLKEIIESIGIEKKSVEELAKEYNIEDSKIQFVKDSIDRTVQFIDRTYVINNVASIDTPIGDGEESVLSDFVQDENDFVLELENNQMKPILYNLLKEELLFENKIDSYGREEFGFAHLSNIEILTVCDLFNTYNKCIPTIEKSYKAKRVNLLETENFGKKLSRSVNEIINFKNQKKLELGAEISKIDESLKEKSSTVEKEKLFKQKKSLLENQAIYARQINTLKDNLRIFTENVPADSFSDEFNLILNNVITENYKEYEDFAKKVYNLKSKEAIEIRDEIANQNMNDQNEKINDIVFKMEVQEELNNIQKSYINKIKSILSKNGLPKEAGDYVEKIIKKEFNINSVSEILQPGQRTIDLQQVSNNYINKLVMGLAMKKNIMGKAGFVELIQFHKEHPYNTNFKTEKGNATIEENMNRFRTAYSKYRQLNIMDKRLGLHGDVWTLEQLGQNFGVSRERIRQIESKLTKKMQKKLKVHIEEKTGEGLLDEKNDSKLKK